MTPRQLFELVQEHLRDEVSSVVQTLLEGHKSERDRLLAEHNKKWAQDIVRRVQGALNAVEALANRPEGDVTAPVGPATH